MVKFVVKIKGILKCKDEYLIVKKWYDDRIEDPYQWEFLDKYLEEGSAPEEQCLNYVLDCTGIYAEISSIAYTWTYKLGDNNYLGIAFLCEVDDELVFLSEELCDYRWVKAEELSEYITNASVIGDMKQAGIL